MNTSQDMNDQESVIYLDYNATTPIHPKAGEEMIPYITKFFGNPSSSHIYGNKTKMAIQNARNQVSKMLNASSPNEILFTSGGSESNNYAIKASVEWILQNDSRFTSSTPKKCEIITSEIEHPSVMEVFKYFESNTCPFKEKLQVHYLKTTSEGMIDLDHLKSILNKETTGFISVMHANNETGVLQPIKEMTKIAKTVNPDIIVHTDAAQSIGKVKVDVQDMGVDLLSVCSHKFYGPKGIGALFMKSATEMAKKLEKCKQIHGASHEKNLRAGTENVLEIVGLGKASELVFQEFNDRNSHFRKMRDLILEQFSDAFPKKGSYVVHGPEIKIGDTTEEQRLPNTLYISFPGIEANLILDYVSKKVAISAGAACHSEDVMSTLNHGKQQQQKNVHMSHVLKAMKVAPNVAMGTLRISTGIFTTTEQIMTATQELIKIITKLRSETSQSVENCSLDEEFPPLTKTTHGLGCGCKIPPKTLSEILESLPKQQILSQIPNILVGTETNDDCCVYALPKAVSDDKSHDFHYFDKTQLSQQAIVQTLDFFTPICDSPRDYGAISASNSLSDIWAMGAFPIFALNIVTFPIKLLPKKVLSEILLGAQEKCNEAGVPILGGHSVEDTEPKFGMSVCGLINLEKRKIWKNCGAKPGDVLCITKPIGVGVLMTAVKREMIKESTETIQKAINHMKTLNKYAAEAMIQFEEKYGTGNQKEIVSAVTDVTGFGFMVHLKEMLEGTSSNLKLNAKIYAKSVPFLEKAQEFVNMDVIPGGSLNNFNFSSSVCKYDPKIDYSVKILLNDAQTSGGLMFAFPKSKLVEVKKFFDEAHVPLFPVGEIEQIETSQNCQITVLNEEFNC